MEKITVELNKTLWVDIATGLSLTAGEDYTIKKIEVEDDFFKDDPTWHTMKSELTGLQLRLKDYETKQRKA